MPEDPSPRPRSLALLTDLYELTMACGYWKSAMASHEAVFHLFFRSQPFGSGFSICAGLGPVIELLQGFRFDREDLAYLGTLRDNAGRPLFEPDFLDYLARMEIGCDIDAIPEGTLVFPEEPLVRVKGPLIQCQVLESVLLNIVNFQTLIATKSARVCLAAQSDPVLEFGLRRAQGIDGALAASRAAYIGGCAGTSNVLAGKLYGIPVKGTHAHSWVMAFDSEEESFRAYAEAMPDNCVLLVDTYDTIEGVRRAVRVGQWLAERGHRMAGIRLDSGDIASLSFEARRLLDQGGLKDTVIVASNELDEYVIHEIKSKGAPVGMWGVGTKLATGYDEPALGGVYKLSALRKNEGEWRYKVKLSDEPAKVSNPGVLQVRRFREDGHYQADIIYDEGNRPQDDWTLTDPEDASRQQTMPSNWSSEDLLQPVFRQGQCVYDAPAVDDIRKRTQAELAKLKPEFLRIATPATYSVGLESGLAKRKAKLVGEIR